MLINSLHIYPVPHNNTTLLNLLYRVYRAFLYTDNKAVRQLKVETCSSIVSSSALIPFLHNSHLFTKPLTPQFPLLNKLQGGTSIRVPTTFMDSVELIKYKTVYLLNSLGFFNENKS